MEDFYVKLAKESLESYIVKHRTMEIPSDTPKELLEKRAGVFVSLKIDGNLRGCIGTIFPARKNIAEEILQNAIHAGTRDPRFPPVSIEELPKLTYSVDVLMGAEPVSNLSDLDEKKYGVIVSRGHRKGLLLPDLEGVESVQQQLEIALMKAGINAHEQYKIEKFEVIRHGQK